MDDRWQRAKDELEEIVRRNPHLSMVAAIEADDVEESQPELDPADIGEFVPSMFGDTPAEREYRAAYEAAWSTCYCGGRIYHDNPGDHECSSVM